MRKKTNKSPKLRELTCVICGNIFHNYISPSEIAQGKGKTCSRECRIKSTSINKSTGKYVKCIDCGKDVWERPSRKVKRCSECHANIHGKSLSTDGYYIYNKKKVHRTIYEEYLGRKLKPNEIVHHINGNKLDNRLENLELVDRGRHNKIHFGVDDGLTNIERYNLVHKGHL